MLLGSKSPLQGVTDMQTELFAQHWETGWRKQPPDTVTPLRSRPRWPRCGAVCGDHITFWSLCWVPRPGGGGAGVGQGLAAQEVPGPRLAWGGGWGDNKKLAGDGDS